MPAALVFSRTRSLSDRWAHTLEDYGWDALEIRRLEDLAVSHRVRAELAIVDIENHQDLIDLAALGRAGSLPPTIIRVSPLFRVDMPGTWRASVHVGPLADRDLVAAVARLRQASVAETTLPVRLPGVTATKWSVKLRSFAGRFRSTR